MRQLEQVVALPEGSPQRSAWLVNPAVRWARERPAGELLERYGRLLLMTLGVLGPEREQFLGRVASTDPVVLDAGLFDGGLFHRYLTEALNPGLLSRSGPLADWPAQPTSVWRFESLRSDCIDPNDSVLLCDLWSLEPSRAVAWPAAQRLPRGALIFGRLVPVPGPIGWTFALPPVRVDQRCAARLLRARKRGADPEERLRADRPVSAAGSPRAGGSVSAVRRWAAQLCSSRTHSSTSSAAARQRVRKHPAAAGRDEDVVLDANADPRNSGGTVSSSGWKYRPGSTVSTMPSASGPRW